MSLERANRDYRLLWETFKRKLAEDNNTAMTRLINANGVGIDEFALVAARESGRNLAYQDVLALVSQLEEAESDGSLGAAAEEEDDDGTHRRGNPSNRE